ncbi:MAG: hypothetical protein WDO17_00450 [Alphaproteobacteria bacterium]
MSFWTEYPAVTAAAVGGIAGLVGGIVSAISKGFFDERVQEKRLRFERDNARQQKLIEAQSALLDELGSVCWKWRYDAIRVAYYGRELGSPNDSVVKRYEEAAKNYVENIWANLNQIRFLGTRAGRIFCKSALDEVERFYKRIDDVDSQIEKVNATNDMKKKAVLLENIYPVVEDDLRKSIADLIFSLAKQAEMLPGK